MREFEIEELRCPKTTSSWATQHAAGIARILRFLPAERMILRRTARIGTPVDAFEALGAYQPDGYSWMDPANHGKRMHLDYVFVGSGLESRLRSGTTDTSAMGPTTSLSGSRSTPEKALPRSVRPLSS